MTIKEGIKRILLWLKKIDDKIEGGGGTPDINSVIKFYTNGEITNINELQEFDLSNLRYAQNANIVDIGFPYASIEHFTDGEAGDDNNLIQHLTPILNKNYFIGTSYYSDDKVLCHIVEEDERYVYLHFIAPLTTDGSIFSGLNIFNIYGDEMYINYFAGF